MNPTQLTAAARFDRDRAAGPGVSAARGAQERGARFDGVLREARDRRATEVAGRSETPRRAQTLGRSQSTTSASRARDERYEPTVRAGTAARDEPTVRAGTAARAEPTVRAEPPARRGSERAERFGQTADSRGVGEPEVSDGPEDVDRAGEARADAPWRTGTSGIEDETHAAQSAAASLAGDETASAEPATGTSAMLAPGTEPQKFPGDRSADMVGRATGGDDAATGPEVTESLLWRAATFMRAEAEAEAEADGAGDGTVGRVASLPAAASIAAESTSTALVSGTSHLATGGAPDSSTEPPRASSALPGEDRAGSASTAAVDRSVVSMTEQLGARGPAAFSAIEGDIAGTLAATASPTVKSAGAENPLTGAAAAAATATETGTWATTAAPTAGATPYAAGAATAHTASTAVAPADAQTLVDAESISADALTAGGIAGATEGAAADGGSHQGSRQDEGHQQSGAQRLGSGVTWTRVEEQLPQETPQSSAPTTPGAAHAAQPTEAPTQSMPTATGISATTGPAAASGAQAPAGAGASPMPTQAQLVSQLGGQLVRLREAAPGEHVMTMRVTPESFGPVRVVAHIGPEGVRIELLGATDAAREALKTALGDLRRDLAATGLKADLQLTSEGRQDGRNGERAERHDGAPAGERRDANHRDPRSGGAASPHTRAGSADEQHEGSGSDARRSSADHRLDLIA